MPETDGLKCNAVTNPSKRKLRLAAVLCLLPLAVTSCSEKSSGPEPTQPPAASDSSAPDVPAAGLAFDGLEEKIAAIEEKTNTQASFSLFDGTTATNAGSGGTLPAWSTIKVPIALSAWEHCEDKEFVKEQTTAAIEWSDNDAAYALWRCLGSDEEASQIVGDEIASAGVSVHVEPAFGTTSWPIPAQARYAQHLVTVPADNPVIQEMHKIDAEHSYGLGTIADLPFKGGWSDAPDASFHVRQLGFFTIDGTDYGVAIAARSILGSEQDCQDALTELAALLADSSGQLHLKSGQPTEQTSEEETDPGAQAGGSPESPDSADGPAEQDLAQSPQFAPELPQGSELPHMPDMPAMTWKP